MAYFEQATLEKEVVYNEIPSIGTLPMILSCKLQPLREITISPKL
jgi:hypothetical protein